MMEEIILLHVRDIEVFSFVIATLVQYTNTIQHMHCRPPVRCIVVSHHISEISTKKLFPQ